MQNKLVLIRGCMFSAKSTSLLSYYEKYKLQNKRIEIFKPELDRRYSESEVVTHSGLKAKAIAIQNGQDIYGWLELGTQDEVEVILIDEFFMIPGIADVCIHLFKMGKTIVISTLDLSANLQPFKEVEKIMPFCTDIETHTAICTGCLEDNARYTYAKINLDNEITVGGSERFEPKCFKCYFALKGK